METHGDGRRCGNGVQTSAALALLLRSKAAFKAHSSAFLSARRAAERHSFDFRRRSLCGKGTHMKQLSTEQRLTRLIELKAQRDEIDREIAVLLGDTRGVPVPLCEI